MRWFIILFGVSTSDVRESGVFAMNGDGNPGRSGMGACVSLKRGIGTLLLALVLFIFGSVDADVSNLELATKTAIREFFDTDHVKLVFSDADEGLYCIDFSESNPRLTVLAGTQGARFPVLSPDGQWVTYCTGVSSEYSDEQSTVWLRALTPGAQPLKVADNGYVPRFVYNAADPTVLYATCARDRRTVEGCTVDAETILRNRYTWEGCGSMMTARLTGTTFEHSVFRKSGSYLGGLSRDGRYLAHAEQKRHAFILDVQGSDSTPGVIHCLGGLAPQVCNSSASPSFHYSNTILYFDFGAGENPTGLYRLHTRIFLSRIDGAIMRWYTMPRAIDTLTYDPLHSISNASWENPEWSNHPYYAVTTVKTDELWQDSSGMWNHRYSIEKLYGINLRDSAYCAILRPRTPAVRSGISIANPWLWVEIPAGFQEAFWLETPAYFPGESCELEQIVTCPVDSSGTQEEEIPDNTRHGCGRGAGLAFLVPVLCAPLRHRRGRASSPCFNRVNTTCS